MAKGVKMPDMEKWKDSDLLDALRMVDEGDWEVTDWEANFIETVLSGKTGKPRLSRAQRDVIIKLAKTYLGW